MDITQSQEHRCAFQGIKAEFAKEILLPYFSTEKELMPVRKELVQFFYRMETQSTMLPEVSQMLKRITRI